ncbi:MAG: hypothetical protein M1818_006493 [Claussenomyces sp. TS43310]|nr:MAG: hypothetical protein M1818_006493 [Claussenomyces sp. TS43310]
MNSLQAKVDSVKIAVTSVSTCNVTTVSILNELLLPDTHQDTITTTTTTTARPRKTASVSAGPKRTARAGVKTVKKSLDQNGEPKGQLSIKSRATLATEVVNFTLKALDNAIKAPLPAKRQARKDLVRTTAHHTLRRSISLPHTPSHRDSLERVPSSPVVLTRLSRSSSSSSASGNAIGHKATAECARIAFACLRTLQNSKTQYVDLPPLRLESGMSALIARLITLGLDELAVYELRILKRRLDGGPQLAARNTSRKPIPNVSSKETLVDLLEFSPFSESGPALSLAITTQIQVLKLLATCNKPQLITAALPKLQPEYARSLVQLLVRSSEVSDDQAAKVARQLETVSLLLLSLGPSISTSDDSLAVMKNVHIRPEIAFQLQILAYRIRLMWWKLAGHQGDLEEEILGPLSHCLAAFSRRSQCSAVDNYSIASKAFENFRDLASPFTQSPLRTRSATSNIYKVLGTLAQDAAAFADAVEWTQKLRRAYTSLGTSDVQQCAVAARLVALHLRLFPLASDVEKLLLMVTEGMQGPLKGESRELDELLVDVSRARTAAVALLSKQHNRPDSETTKLCDGIRQACESLVLLCPKFALRYLGKRPSPHLAKEIINYEQRRKVISKIVVPTVDSALYLFKLLRKEGRLTWEVTDSALQYCLALLEATMLSMPDATEHSCRSLASYPVRISHLYYSHYLDLQIESDGVKEKEQLRALRRSIDCIQACSLDDKKAAFLITKLHKLAASYSAMGRMREAKDTLITLRDELIGSGALSAVAAAADSKPLQASWDINDESASLARAIVSLVRLEVKMSRKSGQVLTFADVPCSVAERGVMLETVLETLSNQQRETTAMQKSIIQNLLQNYDAKVFPMRRLRVLIHALRHDVDQGRGMRDEARNTLALVNIDTLIEESKDVKLRPYLTHLKALTSSLLELQEEHPRVDLIRLHLAAWCSLLLDTKDLANLDNKIDSIPQLLLHLHCIADYLDLKGFGQTKIAVLRMIATLNESPASTSTPDDLLLSYTFLGLQYLHLGYSGKAGLALDKAYSLVSRNGVTKKALLRYHLSYAEYSMAIGNVHKCEETLQLTQLLAEQESDISKSQHPSSVQRLQHFQMLADASLLHSNFEMHRSTFPIALGHARRCVRLMRRAWNMLEKQTKVENATVRVSDGDDGAQDESDLSMSTTFAISIPSIDEQVPGPAFWPLIYPLFRSLSHLSQIYAHQGMFQETMYYAEQAQSVVRQLGTSMHAAQASASLGSIWMGAGVLDKASKLLLQANDISVFTGKSAISVMIGSYLGKLHGILGSREEELTAYGDALAALENLTDIKYISGLDLIVDPASALEAEMSSLSLAPRKVARPRRTAPLSKSVAKKPPARSEATVVESSSVSDECLSLKSLKGLVLRHKARALLQWKRCEQAHLLLKESDACAVRQDDSIQQHLGMAKQLVHEGIVQMTTDPVYSVLQDSTISYPSITGPTKAGTTSSERNSVARLSPARKKQGNGRSKSPSGTSFIDKLRQAQDHLLEALSVGMQISPTALLHEISTLLSTTMILLSAAGPSKGKMARLLGFSTCSAEMVKTIALTRERAAVVREESSRATDECIWPNLSMVVPKGARSGAAFDVVHFQQEYIDIIPPSWTAISISLSESRHELCVTKMQAGYCPFVLRLPLGRNISRDADEEVFDFEQGRLELAEIIDLANASSHGARDISGRGAKTAWWAEREELDARLKNLLENIEKVWLGGFSGIFSQHTRQPDVLARFQRSFQNILDKHLPSRQKIGKKTKSPRVTLDTRILELFVGLGNPSREDCDLDEPLMDLLYFVVDILQFQGENNAYDEIDLDSMVVETQDALRCYHEAASTSYEKNEDRHTVLILDKALHAFPWESLPCMEGLAVSRLPSLGCLRDRLLAQQAVQFGDPPGHYIDRNKGAYILNPSNDLVSTQSTFAQPLQSLSTWSGIDSRVPSEAEFQAHLTSSDLLLYFGHGSGAQYIRPKVVKRLDRCAVTLLMGCSSGALTDAGDFEPYGTPVNYMLAGCPALVATLWDVTDKDIDRFAKRTFEEWGLFDAVHKPPTAAAAAVVPTKAKGKKVEDAMATSSSSSSSSASSPPPRSSEPVSLVRAVARGREACQMRYLTAAAVCVYGIPVYFKS